MCPSILTLRSQILPGCVFDLKHVIRPLCFDLSEGYPCRNPYWFNFFKVTQQTIPPLEGYILSNFFRGGCHIYIYLYIYIHIKTYKYVYVYIGHMSERKFWILRPRQKVPLFAMSQVVAVGDDELDRHGQPVPMDIGGGSVGGVWKYM